MTNNDVPFLGFDALFSSVGVLGHELGHVEKRHGLRSAAQVMMIGVVAFGNYRTFTAGSGFGTIAWLLITHAVFGIVLGNVYARLVAREKRGAVYVGGAHAH